MSKDKDKNIGRKGERKLLEKLIFPMEKCGEEIDYKKPTYTNEPDNGVDIEVKAPYNTGERFDAILRGDDDIQPPSITKIDIRIDCKNYKEKVGKPIVDKFIDDIPKNPNDDEHWLVGGHGLTGPAQKALKKANKPVRYYSEEQIDTLNEYYENQLESMDNDNDN